MSECVCACVLVGCDGVMVMMMVVGDERGIVYSCPVARMTSTLFKHLPRDRPLLQLCTEGLSAFYLLACTQIASNKNVTREGHAGLSSTRPRA